MRVFFLSVAALAVATGGALAQSISIAPGQWEYKTAVTGTLSMGGSRIPIPGQSESSQRCVTEENATMTPEDVAEDGCAISNVAETGTALSFDMACDQNGVALQGRMEIERNSEGTQTSGAFTMSGSGQGMNMDLSGTLSGVRIGDCA